MNLQEVDLIILRELQKNARVTNKELARAAGIAESTCLERVRALHRRGIIKGWHADVDLRLIGRAIRALVHIRLQPKTTASVIAFEADVMRAPETISVRTVSGTHDFIVEVAVAEVQQLRTYVLEHVTSRHDVADAQTSLVFEYRRKFELGPLPPSDEPGM